MGRKNIFIVAVIIIAFIVISLAFFTDIFSPCCPPRTGFACKFCPGISDNECESWITDNNGICIENRLECPDGYKRVSQTLMNQDADRYLCSNVLSPFEQEKSCCLPTDFVPKIE